MAYRDLVLHGLLFMYAHTDALICKHKPFFRMPFLARSFTRFTHCNMSSQWCAQPWVLRNTYCPAPSQPSLHQRARVMLWFDGCWAGSSPSLPPPSLALRVLIHGANRRTLHGRGKQQTASIIVSRCTMSHCIVGKLDCITQSVSVAQLHTVIFFY